jgi:hypothetical protein
MQRQLALDFSIDAARLRQHSEALLRDADEPGRRHRVCPFLRRV